MEADSVTVREDFPRAWPEEFACRSGNGRRDARRSTSAFPRPAGIHYDSTIPLNSDITVAAFCLPQESSQVLTKKVEP